MVKAVWADFQGQRHPVRDLQPPLIGLVFASPLRILFLSQLGRYLPGKVWNPVGVILLHPTFIRRGFGFALRTLGEKPRGLDWGYRATLGQLFLWVINGAAYYLPINSLIPSPPSQLPMVVGALTIAWGVGFLALFAPAGLGVVEGTLAFHFLAPVATVVALFTRLMRTMAELICALIAWRL